MENDRYRILIADDEPIERKVVSKIIQNHFENEVEIWEAVNGREAVEIYKREKCQIAVLDISMPGINGLEAAEIIRESDKSCILIFLTAYEEFDFAKRAIRMHALDYLLKPGTKEEIIAVLEEAVHIAGERKAGGETAAEDIDIGEERGEPVKYQLLADHVRNYIAAHYMEDICLQDMAKALHYSDTYFCRFFKQNFDKNFIMYLSEFRVERAKELLEDVTVNIKDVSRRVGYRDSNYFTKVFKRITGMTPSEYRGKRTLL